MISLVLATLALAAGPADDAPRFAAEQIFPPNPTQTHAPGIAEAPDGGLIATWYADRDGQDADSAIFGARKVPGATGWTPPFPVADRPGFPDGNTTLWVDGQSRLWLFWPTILGSSWESCLLNYKVARSFSGRGAPAWDREGILLLKPADFREEALQMLGDRTIRPPRGAIGGPDGQRAKLGDPLFQRLGWATRCKPTVLPGGRVLLPLYSDTFSIAIMAISDDGGETWRASKPLLGFGNIQPTVLRRDDGRLVAYMRDAGPSNRIKVSESTDGGETWGPVRDAELPNPGSGIDAVRLANGHWLLVFNDDPSSRARLAVAISDDEGRTWGKVRHLERHAAGRYHYPAVIQGRDGTIHVIYSTFIAPEPGDPAARPGANVFVAKGIKHAAFNEAWVRAGD